MTEPYPKELFKYLLREHADAMVTRGQLRVGTLLEYRATEQHGDEVGDAQEGTLTNSIRGGTIDWRDQQSVPWLLKEVLDAPPTANIQFRNSTFVRKEEAPPSLIYCASKVLDAKAMHVMGYDAAVRIFDVLGFFRALNDALLMAVPGLGDGGARSCVYEGRDRSAMLPRIHPAWAKEPRYAHQAEYRAAWRVPPSEARARVVASEGIAATCELVDLPKVSR